MRNYEKQGYATADPGVPLLETNLVRTHVGLGLVLSAVVVKTRDSAVSDSPLVVLVP